MATTRIDGVSAVTGTSEKEIQMACNNHAGLCQITFGSGATGTVTVYGKLTSAHDYFSLASYVASGVSEVAVFPFMKITWAVTGGNIEATILEAI